MALYDRDYARTRSGQMNMNEGVRGIENINTFVKQTYQLFAASLLVGALGAYVGIGMAPVIAGMFWILFIVEIGLLIGLHFVINKPGINLAVLFGFTFVSGLTLAPLLVSTLNLPGGGSIVANAFLLTSVAFGGLSLFAMNTKKDFTVMGKMLFITLIVVVVAAIINIFMQSPIMQLVIASISAILFSAFILYDTQNIIKGNYSSPIQGAVALYLDFFNLFVALLQILGIFGRDE